MNQATVRSLRLLFSDIPPGQIRKNFELLSNLLGNEALFKFQWAFLTFSTSVAVTDMQVSHSLGFVPLDILFTKNIGGITFNYPKFTDKFIVVTTTGPAEFRGLLGRYRENFE